MHQGVSSYYVIIYFFTVHMSTDSAKTLLVSLVGETCPESAKGRSQFLQDFFFVFWTEANNIVI